MTRKMLVVFALAGVLLAALVVGIEASIVNGGFEDEASSVWVFSASTPSFTGEYYAKPVSADLWDPGFIVKGKHAYRLSTSGGVMPAGSYCQITQKIDVPVSNYYQLDFWVRDDYESGDGSLYGFKQVLIDGQVVWEESEQGKEGWIYAQCEVNSFLQGKTSADLTLKYLVKHLNSKYVTSATWDEINLVTEKPAGILNGNFESGSFWKTENNNPGFQAAYDLYQRYPLEGMDYGQASFKMTLSTPVAGNYLQISQEIKVPDYLNRCQLAFLVKDDYPLLSASGGYRKQLLIDGEVVWEEDPALDKAGNDWSKKSLEVEEYLRGKKQAAISLRVDARQGSGQNLNVWWDSVKLFEGIDYQKQRVKNLQGSAILGTYAQYVHVNRESLNVEATIKALQESHYNTLSFAIYDDDPESAGGFFPAGDFWEFKKFLPEAEKAGIKVLAVLSNGNIASPYLRDYFSWSEELAKLSLIYPNLVGMEFDDFDYQTRGYFNRNVFGIMMARVRAINPWFVLLPQTYRDVGIKSLLDEFSNSADGITYCYRSNPLNIGEYSKVVKKEAGEEKLAIDISYVTYTYATEGTHLELEKTYRQLDGIHPYILNFHNPAALDTYPRWEEVVSTGTVKNGDFENSFEGWNYSALSANWQGKVDNTVYWGLSGNSYQIAYPAAVPAVYGEYAQIAQTITVPLEAMSYRVGGRYKDSLQETYDGPLAGYVRLQLLVNGQLVWESDLARGYTDENNQYVDEGWNLLSQDITEVLKKTGTRTADLVWRVIFAKSAGTFPVNLWLDELNLIASKTGFGNGEFETKIFPGSGWWYMDSRKIGSVIGTTPDGANKYYAGGAEGSNGGYDPTTVYQGTGSYKLNLDQSFSSGDYLQISQVINIPVLAENYNLQGVIKDDYNQDNPGKYSKQILIDGEVVWEEDAAGEESRESGGWLTINRDVSGFLQGKVKAEVEFRLLNQGGTEGINVWWDNLRLGTEKVTEIPVPDAAAIRILRPLDGAKIYGIVPIEVFVPDNSAVSKVEFYVDDGLLKIVSVSPYLYYWDCSKTPAGDYRIKVIVYDLSGGQTEKSLGVSVFQVNGVAVYPNPYVKGRSSGDKISFINLPKEAGIRIYTVSGELIEKIEHKDLLEGGKEEWDVSAGEISSGIYLYVITSSDGVKKGKISVIK